jgi:hypothetical protein
MNEETTGMDPKAKALIILFALLLIGAFIGFAISLVSLGALRGRVGSGDVVRALWRPFANNFSLATIIITMNLFLIFGLLVSYIQSFRKTKSSFLLGLVLFLMVLFVQSLLSLPLINLIISVTTVNPTIGLSYVLLSYQSTLLQFLANLFETIALIILFYLSME